MSNAKLGRKLFDEDAEISVFRASANENDRHVNVYPRKSQPGFVYCVWGPGVGEIGTDAILDGGVIKSLVLADAASEAVDALFNNV